MLSSSLDTMLKLSKTSSPQKLFDYVPGKSEGNIAGRHEEVSEREVGDEQVCDCVQSSCSKKHFQIKYK